jgi:hypothetical protein
MNDHANGNDLAVSHLLRRSFALCLLAVAGCMTPAVADNPVSAVPTHWRGTPAEKDVAWLLDDVLAGRSADYRAAVEEVLQRQARFCDGADRLDRVTVYRVPKDDGTIMLSLESRPGRNGHGDSHPAAMTLRDGAVVRLRFFAESAFDDCPCMETLDTDYVDDGFLEVVERIDTLEEIDHLPARRVTVAGIRSIARLSRLKSLELTGVALSCDDLEPLGALQRLEKLSYRHAKGKAREPARLCALLARHPMLRDLELVSVDLTREAAAALASCSRLKTLHIRGTHLESGALEAFAAHENLESLSLSCLAATEPIVLRGGPALRGVDLRAVGPEVEIVATCLPALRYLSIYAARAAPETPAGDAAPEIVAETGRAPRISVDGLAALETLGITLSDRQADGAAEKGKVRLAGLPSLSWLTIDDLDGELLVPDDLPALTTFTAWAADPATVYRSLPRCPNLEHLTIRMPRRVGGPKPAVDSAAIAPLFTLGRLTTLEMSGVRGSPLTFEPFLRLPRLTKLELNDCDVAASCTGAGHPSLERIRIAGSGPRELTLRDMPRLSHVSIWNAGQLETVTLIDCPALEACGIGQSSNLTKLDLREARAKADVDTSLSNIDKRLILRPDRTAEPGATTTP